MQRDLLNVPCLHTSPGVLSKQELQRPEGYLPGRPGSVRSNQGLRRARDQRQDRSYLPSGRNQGFHRPKEDWSTFHGPLFPTMGTKEMSGSEGKHS